MKYNEECRKMKITSNTKDKVLMQRQLEVLTRDRGDLALRLSALQARVSTPTRHST